MTYWFSQNAGLFELRGLKNVKTGVYENGAIVTGKIVDASGQDVPGTAVPMAYEPGSRGNYFGSLPAMQVPEGQPFKAVIEVSAPIEARFEIALVGAVRRA